MRGIVSLPTWLWLEPGSFGRLKGSSAEGLVAVAEPEGTNWNTGDGGSVTCAGGGMPEAAACTHTYARASARYDGNVTRPWRVHYEKGGDPITIPGAPVALTAATAWALGGGRGPGAHRDRRRTAARLDGCSSPGSRPARPAPTATSSPPGAASAAWSSTRDQAADPLDELLDRHRLRPAAVLLTHGHLDHTFSVAPVCARSGVPAYIHPGDRACCPTRRAGWGRSRGRR